MLKNMDVAAALVHNGTLQKGILVPISPAALITTGTGLASRA